MLRRPPLDEPIVDEKSEEWKSKLRGEPVKVRKRGFNLRTTPIVYILWSIRYWVGDEGVKTKLNIALPSNESADDQTKLDDEAVAKSPNIAFDDSSDSNTGPGTGGHGMQFLDEEIQAKTHSIGLLANKDIIEGISEQEKNAKLAATTIV